MPIFLQISYPEGPRPFYLKQVSIIPKNSTHNVVLPSEDYIDDFILLNVSC